MKLYIHLDRGGGGGGGGSADSAVVTRIVRVALPAATPLSAVVEEAAIAAAAAGGGGRADGGGQWWRGAALADGGGRPLAPDALVSKACADRGDVFVTATRASPPSAAPAAPAAAAPSGSGGERRGSGAGVSSSGAAATAPTAAPPLSPELAATLERLTAAAREEIAGGRVVAADAILSHALDLRPGHGALLRLRAEMWRAAGKSDRALALAEAAAAAAPADAGARRLLGDCCADAGRGLEAVRNYSEALALLEAVSGAPAAHAAGCPGLRRCQWWRPLALSAARLSPPHRRISRSTCRRRRQ